MLLIITAAAVLAGAPTDLRPAPDVPATPPVHSHARPAAKHRAAARKSVPRGHASKHAPPAPAKVAATAPAPVADSPAADAPVADAPVADAPVADAPVAAAPVIEPAVAAATVPVAPVAPPAEAQAAPPPSGQADTAEIPPGAPDDDYGLVAWCQGALTGHMALFPIVKPQLDEMEHKSDPKDAHGAATRADDTRIDDEQMQAGRDYLALYAHARQVAEQSGAASQKPRGEAARADGEHIWSAARLADPTTRMWSWVMWELPARCETAARRLETNQGVSGEVVRRHSSDDNGAARPN